MEKKVMLVIDDNEINRVLVETIFDEEYEVIQAENGKDGLQLLKDREGKVDIIILDILMPEMDGYEVLKRVKADELTSDIPVVVVTSIHDIESELVSLDIGASDMITIPFDARVISQRVKNVVQKHALEQIKVENALYQEMRQLAYYDSATGIYNRLAFFEATKEMLDDSTEEKYVLLRYNIEKFKILNDLIGIEKADKLLCDFAEMLKQEYAGLGTYARLEADHFAVCFPTKYFNLDEILQKIKVFTDIPGLGYRVIVDIGIYMIDDKSLPIVQMCDRAYMAIQTIKGNAEMHFAYYDEKIRNTLVSEQEVIGETEEAFDRGDFVIYLQPVYSLSTGRPIAAEALARWIHPEKGIISPGVFIPIFERNGYVAKLDYYVWEEVCKYQKSRREKGLETVPVSVNFSRLSFYNRQLADDMQKMVENYGLESSDLAVEITESAYNDNPDQIVNTVERLQRKGFRVLMDDFGSGYSSLNTLKDISVDTLKVDMKFLEGFETSNRAGIILTSVIRMAKWLNLPIIAEGVETKQQVDYLRSTGCDRIQGYYFAKPLNTKDFEARMDDDVCIEVEPVELVETDDEQDRESKLLFTGNKMIFRLMNGIPAGVGIYELNDRKLEAVVVNDEYYRILGYTPETFFEDAGNIINKVHPNDQTVIMESCLEAYKTRIPIRKVVRRYNFEGHLLEFDAVFNYISGLGNKIIVCISFNPKV